jgi:hypothetical protein
MTDSYTTPGCINDSVETPKEASENVCKTKDEYAAPEVQTVNPDENKEQALIDKSAPTPTITDKFSCTECYYHYYDKVTDFFRFFCECVGGFFYPAIIIPIGCNILLWGWMSVAILNYADVIDLPRKNLFSSSDSSSSSSGGGTTFYIDGGSWDFSSSGGSSGDGDDLAGILLVIFIIIIVIILAMLMPLIYPEFIFLLFYAGYIFASYYCAERSGIAEDQPFWIFTFLTFGAFYQIFYVCYNCGYKGDKYFC